MRDSDIVAGMTVPGWLLWLLVGLSAGAEVALVLNLGLWALKG